jgi:hypothetical protein
MYHDPPKDADIRRLRPIEYDPTNVVVWKAYFGRYSPDLAPTPETTEGDLSAAHAFKTVKDENALKAQELYRNYLEIIEAQQKMQ